MTWTHLDSSLQTMLSFVDFTFFLNIKSFKYKCFHTIDQVYLIGINSNSYKAISILNETNFSSFFHIDQDICEKDEFRCEAGDCIHVSQVCDFIVDCTDGSDEFCGKNILKSINIFQI